MDKFTPERCQFCGSTDLFKGCQVRDGAVFHYSAMGICSLEGSPLILTICKNCKSIVHSEVERLDRLL
ncbi:MAG: hypothetical protein RR058_06250 [Oscillospiraceae bacterium]